MDSKASITTPKEHGSFTAKSQGMTDAYSEIGVVHGLECRRISNLVASIQSSVSRGLPDIEVTTVSGRVENWTLGWAGRITCTLHTAVGSISVIANRDTMPLEIQNGNWVRARLSTRRDSTGQVSTLISANLALPEGTVGTSSMPADAEAMGFTDDAGILRF